MTRAVGALLAAALVLMIVRRARRDARSIRSDQPGEPRATPRGATAQQDSPAARERRHLADHETSAGHESVEVHDGRGSAVLVVTGEDEVRARIELTADEARRIARRLRDAADTGEQTPGS